MTGGAVAALLAGRPPRREVPDLLSWVTCFGMYASVLSDKFPHLTKGLWSYQTFIVREARKCGGKGWQEYDLMFRQQKPSALDLKWTSVNSSLYTVTFGAPSLTSPWPGDKHHARHAGICKWCQEPDHSSSDCALSQSQSQQYHGSQDRRSSRGEQGNGRPRSTQRLPTIQRPCYSWNNGHCRFEPNCRFQHICGNKGCGGAHKAIDCRSGGSSRRPE